MWKVPYESCCLTIVPIPYDIQLLRSNIFPCRIFMQNLYEKRSKMSNAPIGSFMVPSICEN